VSPGSTRPGPQADGAVVGTESDVLAAALRAVGRTRALGMHYYGHLLGITTRRPENGRPVPHLAPDPAVVPHVAPPVVLAAIADLALGSAVRAKLGAGRRLGTVTLDLHHLGPLVQPPVTTEAGTVWVDPDAGQAAVRCDLTDGRGRLVGAGQAWFMALPVPEGRTLPLLPWERDPVPNVEPATEADLDDRERAAVEGTLRAAERARERGTSVGEELTAPTWAPDAADQTARGTLRVGPELTNRVGHVQGGALYGIGLAAAAQAVGPGMVAAEGHVQFLRPADGELLVAEATALRRGRTAAFAEATLSVDGRPVVVGRYAFRPPAGCV
jgi:acyl-coenzyme A thioesterase PaaI-like protein